MDIKEINKNLDPETVLNLIGYSLSRPMRRGCEIRDFCPIHGGDKQQSLAINTTTKEFKCHQCDAHGDLVGLFAQAKGISDIEAVQQLDTNFISSIKAFELDKKNASKSPKKTYTEQDVITSWKDAKEW